jgi:hypothetical protein
MAKNKLFMQYEDKYAPIFKKAMEDRGVDLANLPIEKQKIFQEQFTKYVANQMRREVNEPTKQEFENATPQEQARILSEKSGEPFDVAYERVSGQPRSVASDLYSSGTAERVGDRVSDVLSGAGRAIKGGFAGLTGGDPLEAMAQTPQTSNNILGSILADPMTPVGVGVGKAFQTTAKGLKPLIKSGVGRGLAGGTAQSVLESGERGEFIPLQTAMGNMALNVGGETLGGLGGAGGSRLLKETGGFAGASGKGAKEALEYAKLRPQSPITAKGLRLPLTSNQKELARIVGTESEIGEELVDKVLRFEEFLPETKTIKPILEQMPDIDVTPFVEAIESVKIKGSMLDPVAQKANKEIDNAVSSFIEQIPESGKISASELYDLRKMLDNSINFGKMNEKDKIGKLLEKGYKNARNTIKNQLEEAADANGFPEYKEKMKTLSNKLNVRNKVSRWLGSTEDVADERAEGVVSNLFGKNKTERQSTMKEFDRITNSDIADKAYKSKLGAQIGIEEEGLPLFSDISTGKGLANITGLPSPKLQANVVYPVADALKFVSESGASSRIADLLTNRPREAIEDYFNTQGEY